MTVTVLAEIEACPRRWALRCSKYDSVWSGTGYPPKMHLSALEGIVVHACLQTIIDALLQAGCTKVHDECAVRVMEGLGGYTKVIAEEIDREVRRFHGNPRVSGTLESTMERLRSRIPELRLRTQVLLESVRLSDQSNERIESRETDHRKALAVGSYSEIVLECLDIGWKGRVDLLVISRDGCEILDFKTGERDERHADQLQTYAMLWTRDVEHNPNKTGVTKLTLVYRDGEVSVPVPSAQGLATLCDGLTKRRKVAIQDVSHRPPSARPTLENCRWCDVRHLCEAYWQVGNLESMCATMGETPRCDLEIRIVEQHGLRSWEAVIENCGRAKPGEAILLRTPAACEFSRNTRLRILDGQILNDESFGDTLVVGIDQSSEVFECPDLH
jgi:hypothetical protein